VSQYPSPYSGPPNAYMGYYGQDPFKDLLGPGRRAGILMIVMGVLMLTCGLCVFGFLTLAIDFVPPEQRTILLQREQELGISFKAMGIFTGIVAGVPGLLQIVGGIFVRRGTKVPVYLSIALTIILILLVILNAVAGMLGSPGGGVEMAGALCINGVMVALFILQLVWLFQAARNAGHIEGMRYQQQAWAQTMPPQAYPPQGYPQQGYPQGYAPPGYYGNAVPPPPGQGPVNPAGFTPPPPPPARPGEGPGPSDQNSRPPESPGGA
jgi:hypothetical protein